MRSHLRNHDLRRRVNDGDGGVEYVGASVAIAVDRINAIWNVPLYQSNRPGSGKESGNANDAQDLSSKRASVC